VKKNFMLFTVVSCALLTSMWATTKPEHQPATVVSVQNRETPSNYAGSNPSDAPVQSEVYSYDIGIQVGCTIYRTHYDSGFRLSAVSICSESRSRGQSTETCHGSEPSRQSYGADGDRQPPQC
jgi:hypothetical protein